MMSSDPRIQLHINCLPNELLLYLFSYLSPKALSCSAIPVCHKWKQIACHQSLWHSLTIEQSLPSKRFSVFNVIEIAGSALLSLDISHLGLVTDVLERIAIHCPHLKYLNLGFDQVCSKFVVKNLSELCPKIVSLNLEGTDALDPYESAFYPVANLPSLTKLNLSHCKWVNDIFMHDLAMSNAKIEHVIIDGIPYVTDASMTLFLDNKHSHLKTLLLDGEGLTSSSFLKLGQCLDLEELSILFSENMTNLALEEIRCLKKLKRLHIRKAVDLTSTGIIYALCNATLNFLTTLNLGECIGVNDEVLMRVAPKLPQLKCIRIDWCFDVTNVGFDCIITNCPLLEDISIIGLAKLTSSAMEKVPFLLPHLRLLDLQQCNLISDAIIEQLIELLPALKVLNYYGELFQQTCS